MALCLFTIDSEFDPLADCGRDAVRGDAHVGAHVEPGDAVQVQLLALHRRNCQSERKYAIFKIREQRKVCWRSTALEDGKLCCIAFGLSLISLDPGA